MESHFQGRSLYLARNPRTAFGVEVRRYFDILDVYKQRNLSVVARGLYGESYEYQTIRISPQKS